MSGLKGMVRDAQNAVVNIDREKMNRGKIIRVFPRRTKWTPTDDLAFVGEPPLFNLPDLPILISVTFTWDIKKGIELGYSWQKRYSRHSVQLSGPALQVGSSDLPFVSSIFIKSGVIFTSRGCPKQCPWCLVPKREGQLIEINIENGYIVQDNNLFACSRSHIEKVFDMLSHQKQGIKFSGGLDIDYLEPWHIELLKKIKVDELWVSCDTEKGLKRLAKARDLFSDFSIEKRRCYVLIGFDGDTVDKAERRCQAVYDDERGFLPMAMFYQPGLSYRTVPKEWRYVQWKYSRPAVYRKK